MNVSSYLHSDFGDSVYCKTKGEEFRYFVKKSMINLSIGKVGNVAARIISPFVGLGSLLVSTILRIGTVLEPIFGILADIAVTLVGLSAEPLMNVKHRCVQFVRGIILEPVGVVKDTFIIGIVAGIGGIFAPHKAYKGIRF